MRSFAGLPSRVLCCRDRGVHGLVHGEDLRQAGDLEDLQDPLLGADQQEVTAEGAETLEPTDQDTESGGVKEIYALKVGDDPLRARRRDLDQLLARIQEVEARDPRVAQELRRLAEGFQYQKLLDLFGAGGGH